MSSKVRADIAVVARGFAPTRSQAAALLLTGNVLCGDDVVTKAGALVEAEKLRVRGEVLPYVGRGALKLKGFLGDHPEFLVQGCWCLDIGASTGGFTEVLLEAGAVAVVAVDVGTNQLDYKMRTHSRVFSLEKTDARGLTLEGLAARSGEAPESMRALIGKPFDVIVVDVSFIGLEKIIPSLLPLMKENARLVCLFKPQFQVGPDRVPKGGVVEDADVQQSALEDFTSWAEQHGLHVRSVAKSRVKGREGNQETFLWFAARSSSHSSAS